MVSWRAVHHRGRSGRAEPRRPGPEAPLPPIQTGALHFANGHPARRVTVPPDADAAGVLRALGIQRPHALLLLLGGADELDAALGARVERLFNRGLVPVSTEGGALLLDRGTRQGLMGFIGRGLAERGHSCPLVGVAPEGCVLLPGGSTGGQAPPRAELEPHHSHFVLVHGDAWGAETDMLFRLASTLAGEVPVLVVLVNGGSTAKEEVLRSVRRHWPIVVIQGSGRLADEIATALQAPRLSTEDPLLAEIVGEGRLTLFPLEGAADAFGHLLRRHLGEQTVLSLGWQRFASHDTNAARAQRTFRRLQLWVLVLGVSSTAAVLLKTQLVTSGTGTPFLARLLQSAILVMAASMTILVTATSRFRAGSKWIHLRANAEAIKRELYFYRCQTCPHVARPPGPHARELVHKLEVLSHPSTSEEPFFTPLRSYKGPLPPPGGVAPGDDGFSPLTPARYLQLRLDDQLAYYHHRIDALDRQWVALQWAVTILGGIGTVLAALELALWVALTTSFVMALTTYVGSQQTEARLTRYQRAATTLENIKAWWSALSPSAQCGYREFDTLVEETERVIQGEVHGWVQDMKEVLLRLDARHERDPEKAPTPSAPMH
ncbi:DUF4231 domain-containing protein [Archangium violaceum]|uniref:SMODS and SLOG-associating 2TM effector domain-containing protein n=1 Tax=Archangium violaceum Cb vi76 TaxID=1406225 RepID=A0A084SIB5_9BACT|nr:DUF4231 domain-containing protein [Archangium violaceum]KFA88200.1 hypothetical protein Q664_42515 [Archangium violaceum Cb vi76]